MYTYQMERKRTPPPCSSRCGHDHADQAADRPHRTQTKDFTYHYIYCVHVHYHCTCRTMFIVRRTITGVSVPSRILLLDTSTLILHRVLFAVTGTHPALSYFFFVVMCTTIYFFI